MDNLSRARIFPEFFKGKDMSGSMRKFRLDDLHRLHPASLRVRNVGYDPRERIASGKRTYSTIDYLFIVKGRGRVEKNGTRRSVIGPAMIMVLPGETMEHVSEGEWELLYFGYEKETLSILESMNFIPPEYVWRLLEPSGTLRLYKAILQELANPYCSGFADRMDRLTQALVFESLMARNGDNREDDFIGKVIDYLETHCRQRLEMRDLPKKFGVSRALFYQKWNDRVSISPLRYMHGSKITEACRLMVQTDLKIHEIAERVGYDDPLYFSRKFRKITGESATLYRKRHRV